MKVTRRNNKPKWILYQFCIHPNHSMAIKHDHVRFGVTLCFSPVTTWCFPASCGRQTSNNTESQELSLMCSALWKRTQSMFIWLEIKIYQSAGAQACFERIISFQITGWQQRGDVKNPMSIVPLNRNCAWRTLSPWAEIFSRHIAKGNLGLLGKSNCHHPKIIKAIQQELNCGFSIE